MNIERLKTFAHVMRRQSFAAAAREQNLDPSQVSRDIAALEKELGVRLLQRTTKRLAPTEAGTLYFARIEPLLEELERAALEASEIQMQAKGLLRIASPVSFALLTFVPLLPMFAEQHPEVQFDLLLTDQYVDLLEENIDVAFRLSGEREKDVVAEALLPMHTRVCASPAYLEKHGFPQRPSDLTQHDCLTLKLRGFGQRWRFLDADGFSSEVFISPKLQTSNALALKHCALAGMGMTLQAQWVVQDELERGELIDVFPQFEVTAALQESPSAWLLYPSRAYMPLKVRLFLAFLRQHLKSQ